jgi:hypothetical protein
LLLLHWFFAVQGKGGLNSYKNKLNGNRPGNGRNFKNFITSRNKNGNGKPKGVGAVGGKKNSNVDLKYEFKFYNAPLN